jgi:hypothetical protein
MNYRELQRKYAGLFVAIRDGKVIATGKTYADMEKALKIKVHGCEIDIRFIRPPVDMGESE